MALRLPTPVPGMNCPLEGRSGASCSGWPVGILYLNKKTGRCHLLLIEEWRLRFRFKGKWWTLRILPGFDFDGASIPRAAWSLVGSPFSGVYVLGALAHDACYAGHLMSRSDADELFDQLIDEFGGSDELSDIFWAAVRIGGDGPWDDNSPEDIAAARLLCSITPDRDPPTKYPEHLR